MNAIYKYGSYKTVNGTMAALITLQYDGFRKELLITGRKMDEDAEKIAEAINKAVEIDPYHRYVIIPFSRKTFNEEIEELAMVDLFEFTIEFKEAKRTRTCGMI